MQFSTHLLRFMDTYRKGLDGKQAAWASKKHHGHQTLPEAIMQDLTDRCWFGWQHSLNSYCPYCMTQNLVPKHLWTLMSRNAQ
ncbi:hypothetical protein DFH29DRAFT_809305 [Suillus ampliporus]|nr:hypothetical protein DFH29DRAFT_809305 [Suillus ampliporus]